MGEPPQDLEPHGNDFMGRRPAEIRHEAETARVVLIRRVVHPPRSGQAVVSIARSEIL
jgi:hypothetical protein